MIMTRDQHAGRIHNIKISNKFFDTMNILHMWEQI